MFVCRRILAFGSNLTHVNCSRSKRVQSRILQYVTSRSMSIDFMPRFTKEEQEKILDTLNTSDVDQLSRYKISLNRIKNLKSWRSERGPFQSLSDILEVEGLGLNVLEKLCDQILSDDDQEVPTKIANKNIKNVLVPPLKAHKVQNINTVVGLHLDPIGISWTKMCQEGNVLSEWNLLDFSTLPKKVTPIDLFHMAVRVVNVIPKGDIYILEAPQKLQHIKQVTPTYIQQLEFTSMLITLINTSQRHNSSCAEFPPESTVEEYINKVHFIKNYLPARLFKILVGKERVSSTETVCRLLDPVLNQTLPCTPISISEDQRNMYFSYSPANCHLLGQALLLTISFIEVCVYKNPVSLKALSHHKRLKTPVKLEVS